MENNKEMRKWLDDFKLSHPLVIAGPCSAETEDQVLRIAHELKNSDVSIFRAGIWKPRTRPGLEQFMSINDKKNSKNIFFICRK